VAAIYQSELLGVSISTVLRVQSESIRIAHTQRIRESAAKLPVKMLFPLVFLIFPAIFLVLLGPGLISIKNALGSLK
jgi:tight adherence protein C